MHQRNSAIHPQEYCHQKCVLRGGLGVWYLFRPCVLVFINDTNPQLFDIEAFPQNGVGKAITGEMTIKIKGLCCTLGCNEPTQPSPEQIPFKLYITDRADHRSNEIVLPSISVPCK